MKTLVLSIALTTLVSVWWHTRPSQFILGSSVTDLQSRSPAQRHNIRQSAQALHGVILPPGQQLSFNSLIGPRTRERGYVPAPAFMTANTVTSVGGGICQVSSALYGAALQAGLEIVERHAHVAPVDSVPPGLDATVWFGVADLRLHNPYPYPIQIEAHTDNTALTLRLRASTPVASAAITRDHTWRDPQHLVVNVYRGGHPISSDTYVVPTRKTWMDGLDKKLVNPL